MPSSTTVGISIGDINGVGPEIVIKTLLDSELLKHLTPVVFCHRQILELHAELNALSLPEFHEIESIDDLVCGKVNLLAPSGSLPDISIGNSSKAGGDYAFRSLNLCSKLTSSGQVDYMVTAPIDKAAIQSDEFSFPGHTEYLQSISRSGSALMIMVNEGLRINIFTGHVQISEVSSRIQLDSLKKHILWLNECIRNDFNIATPRIAVLGLNPHAGDSGLIGNEELEIIIPCLKELRTEGVRCEGPFPADGFFGSSAHQQYDVVLAMYHDQGLIPFKTLSFGSGVNFSSGLSFVRTSPDHGTAYNIAGKAKASADSFRSAVLLGEQVFLSTKITD